MALFKIFKGNVENLPLDKHEGYAYFTVDTKELYIDIDNDTRVQVNAEKLSRTIDNSTETIEIDDILELQDHLINKNNPHETTAKQVGADPTGSAQSALRSAMSYVDEKIAEIPTPDVSAQIEEHNTSLTAHDNRNWVSAEDDEEIGDIIPINADTLNGKPGSDYALKEDLKAQTISFTSSVGATGTNVQQAIDELFTSASNGKELIADAITGKGISTSANDTYATMAGNIEKIETGIDISDATLTAASELKQDIVAYSKTGQRIVGSLGQGTVNKPSISVDTDGVITASTSYTSGIIGQGAVNHTYQLSTRAGTTITPGTSQILAASKGVYTLGDIYIAGDTDLKASNIKNGVNIFGITGNYTGNYERGYITSISRVDSTTIRFYTSITLRNNIIGGFVLNDYSNTGYNYYCCINKIDYTHYSVQDQFGWFHRFPLSGDIIAYFIGIDWVTINSNYFTLNFSNPKDIYFSSNIKLNKMDDREETQNGHNGRVIITYD